MTAMVGGTPLLATAAIAAVAVLISAPMVRVILTRARIVDIPNARSSHVEETTRGGGVAVAIGCVAGAALSAQLLGTRRTGLLVVAVGMGLIGLVDDLRPTAALPRLVAQIAVAVAGAGWLCHSLQGPFLWEALFLAGVIVWIVAYVNAFNFMDGINGISVAQVVIAGAVWYLLGVTQHVPAVVAAAVIVAAAGVAFSPFNVPRAYLFLGDVGSYFLGGWLAATAVIGLRAGIPPEAMLSPLALYCADTLTTLIRRIRRGDAWSHPHRDHTYQRLVLSGWSHGRTSITVGLGMAVCGALGLLSLTGTLALRVLGDALIGVVLLVYVMNPVSGRSAGTAEAAGSQPA